MKTSVEFKELADGLAKASAKFPKIERGCTAKVFPKKEGAQPYSYDYADLDDVLSAVRGPLAENGITLKHDARLIRDPLCLEVVARLDGPLGQWLESEPLPMPLEGTMSLAQQIGSAYTYGRRYTSQAILGISTEADDDGHATGEGGAQTGRKVTKPPCPKCGKSEFVLADREIEGRFFCWKNAEKNKLGCGHKWDSSLDPIEPTPEQKAKAKEIANGHGMTTGDKVPPKEKSAFQRAKEEIVKAVRAHDEGHLNKISQLVEQRVREGVISADEDKRLGIELSEARRKIKAMEQEPVGAT